jgi:metallo-beta-lactamase class B
MKTTIRGALTTLLCGAALALVSLAPATAQQTWKQLPGQEKYVRPYEPFRIVGNLYYVGTYDLAVFLITTPQGHMLINTGVNDSAPYIRASIEKLGFKYSDIKLLLATHGHWDHVAAMAQIKRDTGARMLMHEGDADLVESGGSSDYRFPDKGRGAIYEPVKVDQRLKEGDKVRLGGTELTVLHHPGHTKGSSSFTFKAREAGRDYNVLIANMGSINPGVNVNFMPGFPVISEAYLGTLQRQKQLKPDVWVSSHAPQFNMYDKHKPGDKYDPNRFVDPDGYGAKIQFYEKLFRAAMERDKAAKKDKDM